ncbi:MAG TPA: GTP cyclohydrolase I FolE [Clostridia bacterium]|jgi:GTP cyclohydrolase I|nr:GTP cyclohydrolase I FolE [Clostridia bacterium]
MNQKKIAEAMKMFLEAIGEDVEREGLQETPARVARMCQEIFSGIGKEADEELFVCFSEEHEELVLVKDIPLYSFCEHHLLPFFGKAHVAYIPRKGKLTGLSKLARVVEIYARRPQLQERLTSQIADSIMRVLHPLGVIVVIEAEHLCMTIRGVNKPGCKTLTSAVRGIFRSSEVTRAEALALIRER